MFREVLHRFVRYQKRVGRYTVRVDHVGGFWFVSVFGPTIKANKTSHALMVEKGNRIWVFETARQKGLEFICAHVK